MRSDDLDKRMRSFESVVDPSALPGVSLVARLDGRGFTRLTKEIHPFEKPFDRHFHEMMRQTAEHLMADSGLGVIYAYTQSDEISLLFTLDSDLFGRRLRKLHSILAGEASARFSLLLGSLAVFDCRVAQLPSVELVVDYFRWRGEDAYRNALSAHCYWLLRRQGHGAIEATAALRGLATPAKIELLFRHGIPFKKLPSWQKRGSGLSWEEFEHSGLNPRTGELVLTQRRRIRHDWELPIRDAYSRYLREVIVPSSRENSV